MSPSVLDEISAVLKLDNVEVAKTAGHHVGVDQETHPADHDHEGAGGKVGGQVHPRVSLQGDVEP